MVRIGQRLGKYKIRRRIAKGGFGEVFHATDTIEGVDVALKVPLPGVQAQVAVADFTKEARVAARLEHPNILPLKNADTIGGTFVLAYPLGHESLADRLSRRIAVRTVLELGEQLLEALAYAHGENVVHCDVKPENIVLFETGWLRLADFGIAKFIARTLAQTGSGAGTIGYMAPEQAMGRPSTRSDVFSAGLVIYRMLSGVLPFWPFDWPPPGSDRIRRVAPELLPVLQRALVIDGRKRYRDASQMLSDYRSARRKAARKGAGLAGHTKADWRSVRLRQLRRKFGSVLALRRTCATCSQPVDERMQGCPWCGAMPLELRGETRMPAACPRCDRGIKLDWHYCAGCYGSKVGPASPRSYTDKRYATGSGCGSCGKKLIPFSRYCPWCRTRVKRRWKLGTGARACTKCRQAVLPQFWNNCPWCADELSGRSQRG